MCLSNCQQCKYFDRSPHHRGDLICGVNPAYANAFKRLESLDEYSKSCLPIDDCRDFELDPRWEKKAMPTASFAIAFNLSINEWQKLIRESSLPTIAEGLNEVLFEHSFSLTQEDWQRIANSTSIPNVRLTLQNEGIEPIRDSWIPVDSSAIEAIAYIPTDSTLKVRFNTGEVYQYHQVSQSVFNDFLDAPSHGTFLNQHIKNCYLYSRVG